MKSEPCLMVARNADFRAVMKILRNAIEAQVKKLRSLQRFEILWPLE